MILRSVLYELSMLLAFLLGGATGPGTGLVCGAVGTGTEDAETQPQTKRAGGCRHPNPLQRKDPLTPEEAADAILVRGLQSSHGS